MSVFYRDTTPLYKKEGRRYVVACNIENVWEYGTHDVMKPGEFKLVYAYKDGAKRHQYGITPDTAGFVAAAMVAEVEMVNAMHEAWRYTAAAPYAQPFTQKQQKAVAQARDIMEAAGIFGMTWHHGAAHDVARAGIDAVRNFGKSARGLHQISEPAPPKFSTRDDAERLKSVARGMSYNDIGEAVWKYTLLEIAMRLETGGYVAPQPAALAQSAVPRNAPLYSPDDVAFPARHSAEGADVPTELASIAAEEVAAAPKGGQHAD